MDVLVGSGVRSAAASYVGERGVVEEARGSDQGASGGPVSGRMLFKKEDGYGEEDNHDDVVESDKSSPSSSSSSIGVPDDDSDDEDDDDDDEEDGVVSCKEAKKGFGSLASLEDSLPTVKRGLSDHYSGKSRSFTNLAEVTSAKDFGKPEHPFNKRRRILRWAKNMLPNAKSMPLLPLSEEDYPYQAQDEDEDEDEGDDHVDRGDKERLPTPRYVRNHSVFKSYSCFALTDLREEDEEDD